MTELMPPVRERRADTDLSLVVAFLLTGALPELVSMSRAQGVFIPHYIVVETSAHWRMLEKTEKDKLKTDPNLELMETPEPALWLLGIARSLTTAKIGKGAVFYLI